MAREVGDLWPQASGSASLGAEMTNGGFTGATRPFAHIHMSSGILHDPVNGSSGIIRFTQGINSNSTNSSPGGKMTAVEFSFDGGRTFPFRLGEAEATTLFPQGLALLDTGDNRALAIRASGVDTNVIGNYRITLLGNSDGSQPGDFRITTARDMTQTAARNHISAANTLILNATGAAGGSITLSTTAIITGAPINLNATGDILLDSDEQTNINPWAGSGTLTYEFGPFEAWHVLQTGISSRKFPLPHSGQINHMIQASRADIGSGLQKQYNAGDEILLASRPAFTPRGILLKLPVGAKFSKPEDSIISENGYGIAVSGFSSTPTNASSYGISMLTVNALDVHGSGSSIPNIWLGINHNRQAAQLATSGVLRLNAGSGIIVSDCKTTFASSGIAAVNLSGIYARPTQQLDLGDTYMMAHSALENIGINTQADSLAIARAKSLGLATPMYNTGSGLINISNGSGILQCLNTAVMAVTLVTQTLPIVLASPCSDMNYHVGTGTSSGIITILTPGLYKADYKVLSQKTVGGTPQTVSTNATLNNSNILGSFITSFHFDSGGAAANSASCALLFNANAGDQFRLVTSSTLDGDDNCQISLRGALLVIQKIGPKRGSF